MSEGKQRYAVTREGITYGYIEEEKFQTRRWNFVYPIEDGHFSMDIIKVGKDTKIVEFSIDMNKRLMTRGDGTTFDIEEINE